MKMGLFTTALLGLTFLTIQINEYFHIGFAISENAQTTVFYSLTGLHGAHVFVGLTLLTFATIRRFAVTSRPRSTAVSRFRASTGTSST